jgi:hypothetical protein
LFLSVISIYRMIERSKPNRENSITKPRVEINTVAIPTSEIEYSLAAIIQKRMPAEALRILLKTKNIEFI